MTFASTNIKKVEIEGCATANGNGFKLIGESKEIAHRNGQLQQEQVGIAQPSSFIMVKFIIRDGWDDFASVHNIQVQ